MTERWKSGGSDRGPRPDSGSSEGDSPSNAQVPEFLRQGGPSAILERLLDGDPLELEARCREHLAANALLMDPERLFLRVAAVTANTARRYGGWPPLGAWLALQIQSSMEQLRREDLCALLMGEPVEADRRLDYAYLMDILSVDADRARHAALVFNGLPERVRRCWWATAIDGWDVARASANGLGPPQSVLSAVRRAVNALSKLSDPEVHLDGAELDDA